MRTSKLFFFFFYVPPRRTGYYSSRRTTHTPKRAPRKAERVGRTFTAHTRTRKSPKTENGPNKNRNTLKPVELRARVAHA